MFDLHLTDIHQSQSDVAGRTANTHSAITCVGNGSGMTAVIMVAGDNNESAQLRDAMANRITKLVPFD